jgi:hypothetical protein
MKPSLAGTAGRRPVWFYCFYVGLTTGIGLEMVLTTGDSAMKILALDLGKSRSIGCVFDSQTAAHG